VTTALEGFMERQVLVAMAELQREPPGPPWPRRPTPFVEATQYEVLRACGIMGHSYSRGALVIPVEENQGVLQEWRNRRPRDVGAAAIGPTRRA
jgi:hypothetical protein